MADDGGNQIEQQLKEMFPAQSDAKIALAVQQSNQDLSLAIELLLSGVLNEEEEQDEKAGKAESRKRTRNDVQDHLYLKRRKKEILESSPESPPLPEFVEHLPFSFDYPEMETEPYTRDELYALGYMGEIKNKPNWRQKINDPEILKKWRNELLGKTCADVTDYLIKDLQNDALISSNDSFYRSGVDGVYESSDLIPSALHTKFVSEVEKLENIPESQRDWHPFSNEMVLNLVHPSLYCVVFGRTKAVTEEIALQDLEKSVGTGEVVTTSKKQTKWRSQKYQWLPSDVLVDKNGKVTFQSYINGLHPIDHACLYQSISDILSLFVPMWEKTLAELVEPRPRRHEVSLEEHEYSEEEDECGNVTRRRLDYDERRYEHDEKFGQFRPPGLPTAISLRNRKLQVIVKIAEILLTPEKPLYRGGTWHVEGMQNEGIVATAIYYWECENIKDSQLAFRQVVQAPAAESDNDNPETRAYVEALDLMMGPLNQEIGTITPASGKCVTFPNLYQHRVSPFRLEDKNKPGKRKILVFFLVDPNHPILSTSVVPPQQRSWFQRQDKDDKDDKDWPMEQKEAEDHRLKLMEERKFYTKEMSSQVFERNFSLCEH